MTNVWAGQRCRALRDIPLLEGNIAADTAGILREIFPLMDHVLVLVEWDTGLTEVIPATEIALCAVPEEMRESSQIGRLRLAIAAPSALVWYLAFMLGFFMLGWAYLGTSTVLQLFAAIFLSCTVAILLLFWIEELFVERAGWKEPGVSSTVDKRSAEV